jgi:hypothetical protein
MFPNLLDLMVLAGFALSPSMVRPDTNVWVPLAIGPSATQADLSFNGIDEALAALANARREGAAACAELARAQAELFAVTLKLRTDLESGSEFLQATKAMYVAKAHYEKLSTPILASLVQRADYRDAAAALERAQQTSAKVRSRADVTSDQRVAVSEALLAAKVAVANIQNDAINADISAVKAKQAYLQAAQHVRELRAQLLKAIQRDASFIAAKRAVDVARAKADVADENLAAIQERAFDQLTGRRGQTDLTSTRGLLEVP